MRRHKNGTVYRDFFIEKDPLVILCYSGEKCPIEGIWETIGVPKTRIFLSKGEHTPTYLRKRVYWKLQKRG